MTEKVTVAPALNFSAEPQVMVALPAGSRPLSESFQASRFSSAVTAATGGASLL
jgi:hypothetical protein